MKELISNKLFYLINYKKNIIIQKNNILKNIKSKNK